MSRPDRDLLIGMSLMFPRLDIESAAVEVAELGFEALEIHLLQIGPGVIDLPIGDAHAEAAGEAVRAAGLLVSTLNAAGAPGFEPLRDPATAADEAARLLRLAHAMGAVRLLVWDGRPAPAGEVGAAPATLAKCIARGVDRSGLSRPPEVSVELHPFTFALEHGLVAETATALREVGAGVCLDPCHFGVVLGPAFVDHLDQPLLDAINHVHWADTDCATSELHFPLGAGVLDLGSLARKLEGVDAAVAWDLFAWPAPRAAIEAGLPAYRRLVRDRQAQQGAASR